VLDCIGHVDGVAIDARGCERFVEHAPGGPDEGLADDVLFVTRLLADQDDLRGRPSLAEDRLGRVLP
jgi:hypothetical protein